VPTGVHIRDARQHLLDAAERVLRRSGPSSLTSRAVTDEADVAKGVLHRHFTDFDDFLAELVGERIARVQDRSTALRASAGTATVGGNLTRALVELLDPVAVAVVALVVFRDELRTRLRGRTPAPGVPVLAEAGAAIAGYLTEERALGRIAADADVDSLALSLIGAAHLLHAGGRPAATDAAVESAVESAIDTVVRAVTADVVQRRLL
jgi:AcrR family transcriptional regulator